MCGHGTLAAAHALFAWRGNTHRELTFETLSGALNMTRVDPPPPVAPPAPGPPTSRVRMRFPSRAPVPVEDPPPPLVKGLTAALLGASPPFPILSAHYNAAARKLLLVAPAGASAALAALRPNVAALLAVPQDATTAPGPVEGVSITCTGPAGRAGAEDEPGAAPDPDFVQRYWSPWNLLSGEDPVNGSCHTLLAPFWVRELRRQPLVSRSLSPRGGSLAVALHATEEGEEEVSLEGDAVTWTEGRLWV
jgi:predicted PhzF superfamily epimerase YddE/YHI9